MKTNADINVGDVVVCRNNFFIVVYRRQEDAVLCPLVVASDLSHRADLPLNLGDIADANLPVANMRVRAVPCLRRYLSLARIGCTRPSCLARIRERLRTEMAQSDRTSAWPRGLWHSRRLPSNALKT